jgi:hypothetical protein
VFLKRENPGAENRSIFIILSKKKNQLFSQAAVLSSEFGSCDPVASAAGSFAGGEMSSDVTRSPVCFST